MAKKLKTKQFCTKIMSVSHWSKTSPIKTKMVDRLREAIENLEANTESTNQNHWQKDMMKLVLQNKRICVWKSHKFASKIQW